LFPQESLHNLTSERTRDRLPYLIKPFPEPQSLNHDAFGGNTGKILLMVPTYSTFQPLNLIIGLIFSDTLAPEPCGQRLNFSLGPLTLNQ
jgi:hypothetical protein